MKKIIIILILTVGCVILNAQVPQGFNYQVVARGSDGKELVSKTFQVRISILTDTTNFYATGGSPGYYLWEEQQTVTTNSIGLFTLAIGDTLKSSKIQGSAAKFSAINWTGQKLFIGVKINYPVPPGTYKQMGSAKLWSVPYAMVSAKSDSAKFLTKGTKLAVVSGNDLDTNALFVVKRKDGQTVFAVYPDAVNIYVPGGSKSSTKGGFAIGGFDSKLGPPPDYFRVTPDSVRIYIDDTPHPGKSATKGGFAIGGFNSTKGPVVPFVDLTPKNYFIGHEAGLSITTGLYNSFFGYQSGRSNKDGDYNIFIGYQTGFNTLGPSGAVGGSEGSFNCFVGHQAGYLNLHGAHNTAIGYAAGYYNSSDNNTFLGSLSGYYNDSGYSNTFIGTSAGHLNSTGSFNVFLGRDAGNNIINGNWNTLIGTGAGANIGSGDKNIIIGSGAMGENYFAGSGNGSSNIIIGFQAGYSASNSSSNIFIGNQAGYSETSSNKLYIDNSNTSSPLIYGDFTDGSEKITINGNLEYTGALSHVSDIRLKRNIQEINNVMERLLKIRGVTFEWNLEQAPDLVVEDRPQVGVIAQEIENVFPQLVSVNEKGYKMVDYIMLSPIIIEAVKEQQKLIEGQQKQIESTKQENQQLKFELNELKTLVNNLIANQTLKSNN